MNSKEMLRFVQQLTELIEERDRYRDALRTIFVDEGKVCEHYDTCTHESCRSSYHAWALAKQALTPRPPTDKTTTDNTSEQ